MRFSLTMLMKWRMFFPIIMHVCNGSFVCLESNLGIPSGTSKLHQLLDNQDPYMMMMALGHPEGRMEEYNSEGGKDPKDPKMK